MEAQAALSGFSNTNTVLMAGMFPVPLILILPLFFGLDGILYAAPIADFIAFVTSAAVMRRELKALKKMENA